MVRTQPISLHLNQAKEHDMKIEDERTAVPRPMFPARIWDEDAQAWVPVVPELLAERLARENDSLRSELAAAKDSITQILRDHMHCDGNAHSVTWRVLSDDGCRYRVQPNTYQKANYEALLLREPDENGESEPGAKVIEERTCSWAKVLIHEPNGDDS